jgi:hypothetical protein
MSGKLFNNSSSVAGLFQHLRPRENDLFLTDTFVGGDLTIKKDVTVKGNITLNNQLNLEGGIVNGAVTTTFAASNINVAASVGTTAITAFVNASAPANEARKVQFTHAGNDSGETITLVGLDRDGVSQTETITGGNNTATAEAYSTKYYTTVTSYALSATSAANVTVDWSALGILPLASTSGKVNVINKAAGGVIRLPTPTADTLGMKFIFNIKTTITGDLTFSTEGDAVDFKGPVITAKDAFALANTANQAGTSFLTGSKMTITDHAAGGGAGGLITFTALSTSEYLVDGRMSSVNQTPSGPVAAGTADATAGV